MGSGYRTAAYRTGADGRVRIAVDPRFHQLTFEARPDDRTMGWARLQSGRLLPKATDDDPVTLTLLPRNHQVEGTIVDTRGKPIRGVQVRAVQFNHDANGFATDYRVADEQPSLASAVTDEAGRYRLSSLPKDTTAIFAAYHPRFVGPTFACKPDDQTIPSVTLEDAGGIAGTVVDAATGQPVAGRRSVPSASSTPTASSVAIGVAPFPTRRGISRSADWHRASTTSCSDRRRRGGDSRRGRSRGCGSRLARMPAPTCG